MLTTVEKFKVYADMEGDADQDSRIEAVIKSVSSVIEEHCNRHFEKKTVKEWVDGTDERFVAVSRPPIQKIFKVSDDPTCAAYFTYTGSATVATIQVANEQLEFFSVNSSGNESTATIAFSTYKVLSTLKTQAESQVSGLKMTILTGYESRPTALIKSFSGSSVADNCRVDVVIPDVGVQSKIDPNSNTYIARDDGWHFKEGNDNIFVWYEGGYTLPNNANDSYTLPDGLVLICHRIVKEVLDLALEDAGKTSGKVADASYSISPTMMNKIVNNHAQDLANYCLFDS